MAKRTQRTPTGSRRRKNLADGRQATSCLHLTRSVERTRITPRGWGGLEYTYSRTYLHHHLSRLDTITTTGNTVTTEDTTESSPYHGCAPPCWRTRKLAPLRNTMVLDVQHILAFNFFPTPRETIDNPETMVSGLSTVSGGGS